MQFQPISLAIVQKNDENRNIRFEGVPLGRAVDKKTDSDSYQANVEIYGSKEGAFVIYVSYREQSGEINRAEAVKTDSLDLGDVRAALKRADVYPGPIYSEAVYHSFKSLELLE